MPFGIICLIFVTGLALLFAELFVPGAVIGILGTVAVVAGVVLAFMHHPPIYGFSLVFITMIVVPVGIVWWLRQISLSSSQNIEDGYTSADESLDQLIGKEGVTLTLLRPSGMAKIDGKRVDVTSENIVIQKDIKIKVVKVESNRVIVCPL